MTSGRGRNVGASVRARLGNLARDEGVAFDYLLNRYAVERLLHRLSCSPHRENFVLKGATLLRLWSASTFRPTRGYSTAGDAADGANLPRDGYAWVKILDAPIPYASRPDDDSRGDTPIQGSDVQHRLPIIQAMSPGPQAGPRELPA